MWNIYNLTCSFAHLQWPSIIILIISFWRNRSWFFSLYLSIQQGWHWWCIVAGLTSALCTQGRAVQPHLPAATWYSTAICFAATRDHAAFIYSWQVSEHILKVSACFKLRAKRPVWKLWNDPIEKLSVCLYERLSVCLSVCLLSPSRPLEGSEWNFHGS